MRSFCAGCTRAKTEMRARSCRKSCSGICSSSTAVHGEVAIARDAERARDGEAGGLVIAGDHHRPDAGALALGDGGADLVARRVHLAEEAEQSRAALELREAGGIIEREVRTSATASTRRARAAIAAATASTSRGAFAQSAATASGAPLMQTRPRGPWPCCVAIIFGAGVEWNLRAARLLAAQRVEVHASL